MFDVKFNRDFNSVVDKVGNGEMHAVDYSSLFIVFIAAFEQILLNRNERACFLRVKLLFPEVY